MTLECSSKLELGTILPDFNLINTVNNKEFRSELLSKDKGKLIMFICNHCPFVVHYHKQITEIANKYSRDIEIIAISSNDVNSYPEDSLEKK